MPTFNFQPTNTSGTKKKYVNPDLIPTLDYSNQKEDKVDAVVSPTVSKDVASLGVTKLGLNPTLFKQYIIWSAAFNNKDKNVVEAASKIGNLSYTPDIPKDDTSEDAPDNTDLGGNVYGFAPSNTYLKAMEYTNQLLEQLSAGRTSYTDKINSLMDQINGRDPFSYDMNTDTLFQNSLASAMNSGQLAMQDTMGQAAALTGGYGSTYATSAANQAYNGYIQDAYSQLPDYYQLALDAYNQEGQNMYNQLAMYQTADDAEYNRLANAYASNAQAAANLYDQEYNNYWQGKTMEANAASSAKEDYWKQLELYGKYGVLGTEDGGIAYDPTVKNSGTTGSKMYDDKVYNAALKLAIDGGTDDGSEYEGYLRELQQMGYDISTLDIAIEGDEDYIKSQKKKQIAEWFADAEAKKNGTKRTTK